MDTLTPGQRSERMGLIRSKNTKPEILVRRLVHAMGFRFRLHGRKLPGRPDLVFPGRKKAIFVHGCFWHLHRCRVARPPKSRRDFWIPKLTGNRRRDLANQKELGKLGWQFLVVWECELAGSDALGERIRSFLESTNTVDAKHG